MTTTPIAAFLMQSDPAACRGTAAALRDLGFEVAAFSDEAHLYGHVIRVATAPHGDLSSFVILAEPTKDVLQDLGVLRGGRWPTPFVLVGRQADPEIARHLRAACLPCERPTVQELRQAIDVAVEVSTPN